MFIDNFMRKPLLLTFALLFKSHIMAIRIDPRKRFIVGNEISPGGWNASLENMPNSKELILFEQHLEILRLQHKPAAVSRLNCVFSFDFSSGENFLHGLGADKENHDVVRLSYDPTITSKHNYSVISHFFLRLQNGTTLESLLAEEALMILYWTGDERTQYISIAGPLPYNAEILIGGIAQVVSIG